MTRSEVLDLCYYCHSLTEIEMAWKARSLWLKDHPDDWEVLEIGSMLSRLEDAIKITDAEGTYTPAPPLEKVFAEVLAKAS